MPHYCSPCDFIDTKVGWGGWPCNHFGGAVVGVLSFQQACPATTTMGGRKESGCLPDGIGSPGTTHAWYCHCGVWVGSSLLSSRVKRQAPSLAFSESTLSGQLVYFISAWRGQKCRLPIWPFLRWAGVGRVFVCGVCLGRSGYCLQVLYLG